jgi:hypothetical protein
MSGIGTKGVPANIGIFVGVALALGAFAALALTVCLEASSLKYKNDVSGTKNTPSIIPSERLLQRVLKSMTPY